MAYNSTDYTDRLLDHYEHPRNAGDLVDPDAVATVENPACGDTLRLALRIRGEIVLEARFMCQGCPAAIAAGSVTTQLIRGRTLAEASGLRNDDVARALGGLPPAKVHCSVLAEQAIRAVIEEYRRSGRVGSSRGEAGKPERSGPVSGAH